MQIVPTTKRSSRNLSFHSIPSPSSTTSASQHDDSLAFSASNALDDMTGHPNRLGSLADELAEAWDEEAAHVLPVDDLVIANGPSSPPDGHDEYRGRLTFEIDQYVGIGMPNMSYDGANDARSLSPPKPSIRSKPGRKSSNVSEYDGSDYGNESDLEDVQGIPPSLEHRLAAIESLARRGTESNGSGTDQLVLRVAESLRDLGSQAGVETGATRLMTAHTAVASNLAHQTRLIQTLSHHFVSPFLIPPAAEVIDALLPLIVTTLEFLPPPNPRAINSLHSLHSSALELISTLSMLADSLNMLRQTTSLASRKLKAAKDVLDELKKESDIREEGVSWVEKGNWDARLSNRECATICGDVVSGFRDVCEKWETTIQESAVAHLALDAAAG
ncbi:MAG: hypothetical protein LQ345_000580 [Seirophora villosa]|nr:MAG: hypothetical protein LQ345_000580 [Seirophora villosa]